MATILTIQGAKTSANPLKLYHDALVAHGTLALHDYSNTGTLENFSVMNTMDVYDLAFLSSKNELGLDNAAKIQAGAPLNLTPGKGFTQEGISASGGFQGIILNTDHLLKYLYNNQNTHNYFFTFWARPKETGFVGGQMFRSYNASIFSYTDIRVNTATANRSISPTFGGGTNGSVSLIPNPGELIQVGLHFKGIGQTMGVYKNGIYVGEGSSALGFGNMSTKLGIGKIESVATTTFPLYRWFIEDLTISGRTAADVFYKDYCYVKGIKEFSSNTRRPFVNTY